MSNSLKFGPQTLEIAALLARAAHMTPEQAESLEALDSPADTHEAAQRALEDGYRDSGHLTDHLLTLQVLHMAAQFYPPAVINAALALSRKHRIGDQFTQEDYALLVRPWDQVIGIPEVTRA